MFNLLFMGVTVSNPQPTVRVTLSVCSVAPPLAVALILKVYFSLVPNGNCILKPLTVRPVGVKLIS